MKNIFKNQNFLVISCGVDPRLRVFGAWGPDRTGDTQIFSLMLLPTELPKHILDAKE